VVGPDRLRTSDSHCPAGIAVGSLTKAARVAWC
jgi:hypothetical protein